MHSINNLLGPEVLGPVCLLLLSFTALHVMSLTDPQREGQDFLVQCVFHGPLSCILVSLFVAVLDTMDGIVCFCFFSSTVLNVGLAQ